MSHSMSNKLMIFSTALVLAGCSSALSQEAPNTAVITQEGAGLVASLDAQPPADDPLLDGAPSAPAPLPEPLVVEPVAPPIVVPAPAPVPPPARAQVERASFTCDIDVDRTAHGIRITPVVHADRSMSGDYSLVITKSGASGSSDISQGGPFDASRGERVALAASEFSMERGASFRAVLKVRADGHEICRDIRS